MAAITQTDFTVLASPIEGGSHSRAKELAPLVYRNLVRLAASLLARWVDIDVAEPDDPAAMAKWQRWFAVQYPNSPTAELPTSHNALRWQYDQLRTGNPFVNGFGCSHRCAGIFLAHHDQGRKPYLI